MTGGTQAGYSYDRADRITSAGSVSYTVNANGNLVARGGDSFGYDQANRLKSATVGGASATYGYDGDGKRTSKTVGGTSTSYVYDVNAPLPVLLDDGTRKYIWGLGLAYAVDNAGNPLVYHTDGLGSVRALTDANGNVAQSYQYDEYGVPISSQGSIDQPFRYTGEQYDPETGLVYLRARMYDGQTGRFLQADPLRKTGMGSGGWNRYDYAGGSPVSAVDPSGLRTYFVGGIGGAIDPSFDAFVRLMREAGMKNVMDPVPAYEGGDRNTNIGQVIMRSLTGDDPDASRLVQRILKDGPLDPGEQLNLIGYSGGATTVFNAARYLEQHGIPVDNLVSLGGVAPFQHKPANVTTYIRILGVQPEPMGRGDWVEGAPSADITERLLGWNHWDYLGSEGAQAGIIGIMGAHGVR